MLLVVVLVVVVVVVVVVELCERRRVGVLEKLAGAAHLGVAIDASVLLLLLLLLLLLVEQKLLLLLLMLLLLLLLLLVLVTELGERFGAEHAGSHDLENEGAFARLTRLAVGRTIAADQLVGQYGLVV